VLGGYSEKAFGRCVLHSIEQSAEQNAEPQKIQAKILLTIAASLIH
jgi:hypothetical protein